KGMAVVIMGVSGAGKSTIGAMLARRINCSFLDADDYHSHLNKEKMKSGIPLTDEDRIPWLESLRVTVRDILDKGEIAILGCSALQEHYREILRCADPDYEPSSYVCCSVRFILLDVGAEILAARLDKRSSEGNHFMPSTLLPSQLLLLQVNESEGIPKVDASGHPQEILESV
ncbi:gluconokinase, partial [Genlisea aurea]